MSGQADYYPSSHGRNHGGPTSGRPNLNSGMPPYPGMVYFDTDIGRAVVWNPVTEEWNAMGVTLGAAESQGPASLAGVGALHFNTTLDQLEYSDGQQWRESFAEDNEESSSST